MILAILIAWLAYIHFTDERLVPGAAALLAGQGHDQPAPAQNLYFTALGLAADSSEDLNREGQRIYALYQEKKSATADMKTRLDIFATTGAKKLELVGNLQRVGCVLSREQTAHHCIVDVPSNQAQWSRLLADNQRLLQRYRRLWTSTVYADPAWRQSLLEQPISPLSEIHSARHLFLMSLALQIERDDFDEPLAEIIHDLGFWRGLLARHDNTLIDKMVFTARVIGDFEFISEILRTRKLDTAGYSTLQAALAPISTAEMSLDGVMDNEFLTVRADVNYFIPAKFADLWHRRTDADGTDRWNQALTYLLYRPNAFANRQYRLSRTMAQLTSLSCSQIQEGFAQRVGPGKFSFIDLLSDPYKYIYGDDGETIEAYESYPIRMCDLRGIGRVVALQLQIRAAGIADSAIPGYLVAAGADYSDPFTGQPMRWDAARHTLGFDPRDKAMNGILPWPI